MPQDVRDLAAFYESPLGQLAHRAVLREIRNFWPDLRNYRLLGAMLPSCARKTRCLFRMCSSTAS